MPSVEVTIDRDGGIKVEAIGFTGSSCKEATEFLNKLFEEESTEHKPSYYEAEITQLVDPIPSGFCG